MADVVVSIFYFGISVLLLVRHRRVSLALFWPVSVAAIVADWLVQQPETKDT